MDSTMSFFLKCREFASGIDYEHTPVNKLANAYCDATDNGDEGGRNAYLSALILRFWYQVGKTAQGNQTLGVTREDAASWLSGAIMDACDPKARVWRRPGSKVGAQQAIFQVFNTRYKAAAYYDSNLKKNQGKAFMASLDYRPDEDGSTLLEMQTDNSDASPDSIGKATYLIQEFIDRDEVVEAVILDSIVQNDVFSHEKRTFSETDEDGNKVRRSESYSQFSQPRLLKELKSLNEAKQAAFRETYDVPEGAAKAAFSAILSADTPRKKRMISGTLGKLREILL